MADSTQPSLPPSQVLVAFSDNWDYEDLPRYIRNEVPPSVRPHDAMSANLLLYILSLVWDWTPHYAMPTSYVLCSIGLSFRCSRMWRERGSR